MENCDQYLLLEIFKQLQWEHLPTLSLVNKQWLAVTKSPILRAAIGKCNYLHQLCFNAYIIFFTPLAKLNN